MTSPEALREAVERLQSLNLTADAALPMSFSWVRPDVETLLSALQEAREALGPFAEACSHLHPSQPDDGVTLDGIEARQWRRAAEVYRALSPGGADA